MEIRGIVILSRVTVHFERARITNKTRLGDAYTLKYVLKCNNGLRNRVVPKRSETAQTIYVFNT